MLCTIISRQTQPDTGSLSWPQPLRRLRQHTVFQSRSVLVCCCSLLQPWLPNMFIHLRARVTASVQSGQGSCHCWVPCRVQNTGGLPPPPPRLTHETPKSLNFLCVFLLCRLSWLAYMKYCYYRPPAFRLVMNNEKFNIVKYNFWSVKRG